MTHPSRVFGALAALFILASTVSAEMTAREGWAVYPSTLSHADLVDAAKTAAKAHGMGIVTQAGPTGAAKRRGISIPGNRVIGIFNNVLAVEVLGLSTAAMIEAPIRLYITENTDGSATLSYKRPTQIFAPYMDEAGPRLAEIASELDTTFAAIAADAVR